MRVSFADGLADRRGYGAGMVAAIVGVVLLVLMAGRFLDHMPLYDELLHVLAARGMLEHGAPLIADGTYSRAVLFTWLVGQSIAGLGDTLLAARMPSLLACVGLITVMAVWLTRHAGALAGLIAAVFLCLVPTTLDLAVFVRFYALHAVLILIIAVVAYEIAAPERSLKARAWLAGSGLILLLLAFHLQVTTLIALMGIVAGVVCIVLMDHWTIALRLLRQYPWRIVGGLLLLAGIGLLAGVSMGLLESLRTSPVWASGAANRPMYYVVKLATDMPLLWPLFPAAAFVAFRYQRRLTAYCTVLLVTVLAVHSVGGSKALRYIYYALPFFCIVWGCALSGLREAARQMAITNGAGLRSGAVLLATLLVLALSQEGQRAMSIVLRRAATSDALSYAGEARWAPAMKVLQPLTREADRLVTSNSMKALYYLGRYDYELNVSIVAETDTGREFGLDERTGRRAIGTMASIRQVLDMPGVTLVVLENEKFGNKFGVPADVANVIASRCAVIAVPLSAGIKVWRCAIPREQGES